MQPFNDLKINAKFAIILLLFVIVAITNFLVFYYSIDNSTEKTNTILADLAGKNRMLSQKIQTLTMDIVNGKEESKSDLRAAIQQHKKTISLLKNGGILDKKMDLWLNPIEDPVLLKSIANIEEIWVPLQANCKLILSQNPYSEARKQILQDNDRIRRSCATIKNTLKNSSIFSRNYSAVEKINFYESLHELQSNCQEIAFDCYLLSQGTISNSQYINKIIRNANEQMIKMQKGGKGLPPAPKALKTMLVNLDQLWRDIKVNVLKIESGKKYTNAVKFINKNCLELLHRNEILSELLLRSAFKRASNHQDKTIFLLWINLILGFALIFILHRLMKSQIIHPLTTIREKTQTLADGNVEEHIDYESKDEIGEIVQHLNQTFSNLRRAKEFSIEIGKGNFDVHFEKNSEKDTLGESFIQMKEQLMQVAEDDKQRSWTSDGLAKFATILREFKDLDKLCNTIIGELIQHTNAQQGAVYLTEKEDTQEYLKMVGCYAYDRYKFIDKTIQLGEGIVGQSWIEKKPIILKEIPENYSLIASGIGQAHPKFVVIIPMIANEEVTGIIEIASLHEMSKNSYEFLYKVAEQLAGTVSNIRTNLQTKILLNEAKELQNQMMQSEEEMRSTIEETEKNLLNVKEASQKQINRLNKDKAVLEEKLRNMSGH